MTDVNPAVNRGTFLRNAAKGGIVLAGSTGVIAAVEGAWFTGHNVLGNFSWDTHCKVVAAEPGREFTFINYGPNGDAGGVWMNGESSGPPASSKRTLIFGSAERRLARTQPAEPAPMMMKSKVES